MPKTGALKSALLRLRIERRSVSNPASTTSREFDYLPRRAEFSAASTFSSAGRSAPTSACGSAVWHHTFTSAVCQGFRHEVPPYNLDADDPGHEAQ